MVSDTTHDYNLFLECGIASLHVQNVDLVTTGAEELQMGCILIIVRQTVLNRSSDIRGCQVYALRPLIRLNNRTVLEI